MDGHLSPSDLWGKLRAAARGGPAWHPLLDHCTDVACTLRALLDRPTVRRRLAHSGGLHDLDETQVQRLCFLAFIHDLGKCARGFQAKADPSTRAVCGHIAALRAMDEPRLKERFGQALDIASLAGWADEETFCSLLVAVFSHHGRPLGLEGLSFNRSSHDPLARAWGKDADADPVLDLTRLVGEGRKLFPTAFGDGGTGLPATPEFAHLFAGLLMLADWLGSDDRHFFPFSVPDEVRGERAPALAATALAAVGLDCTWLRTRLAAAMPSFEAQFGFEPRPAQEEIDRLPLPGPGGVVLIESETGSGKTEAALRWATRLLAAGAVDGLFFAVPLRSAAVQLHARVEKWLKANFAEDAPKALLAVPGYYRMGEAEGSRILPEFAVQWTDAETTDPKSERWAAEHPKRYAAAAVAVGTIDQALLAVLKTKHAHLRAACLVRHLLVVDEVHSSDPYMRELVLRLIELFRICGGQVLLMSATLGAETRELLLHGRRKPADRAAAEALPYPLISSSHHEPVGVPPDGRRKRVTVEVLPLMDDPDGIAALVADAITAVRRVLVLRNTVGAAIETALAVERALGADHPALFRVGDVVTLHHGRFAAEDRRLLDAAVESRCGRDAPPGGAVIVATQTLEQSLDVDFDLLLTDLCPIDVLLQRIGRLWRHAREGRNGDAPCRVLVPAGDDLTPFLTSRRHGLGPDRAYPDLRAAEATRRLVGDVALWTIPDDNRRLVEVGTHPDALKEIEAGLGGKWVKHGIAVRAISMAQGGIARDNAIDFGEPFYKVAFGDKLDVATRLGLNDPLLPLSRPLASPFGATLERLKLPGWMLGDALQVIRAAETEPVIEVGADRTLTLGGKSFTYDRLGIRPADHA